MRSIEEAAVTELERPTRRASFLAALALVGAIGLWFTGCGEPPVAPQQVSAAALVDEFNLIVGPGNGIDAGRFFDLCHAENDVQRRILAVYRKMLPVFDLDRAMWERFEEGIDPSGKSAFGGFIGTARILENTGQRATATVIEADGKVSSLFLVKIREAWWISGATFERDESFEDEAVIPRLEEAARRMSPGAASLLERVNGGEFEDVAAAREALLFAMAFQSDKKSDE